MKTILVFAMAFCTVFSFAQRRSMQQNNTEERIEQKVDRLTQKLSLTESQQNELTQYFNNAREESKVFAKQQRQKRKAMRKQRRQMKAKQVEIRNNRQKAMQTRRALTEEKMKLILTEDQFNQWKEMREDIQERNQSRKAKRRGLKEIKRHHSRN